jgi:hypothetical protein
VRNRHGRRLVAKMTVGAYSFRKFCATSSAENRLVKGRVIKVTSVSKKGNHGF